MGKDVIIALDFPGEKEVIDFLKLFKDKKPFVKIGMELFYAQGPSIVNKIREMGHKIFLDLKLHDIPNTVEKAMKSLSVLDVDIVNLHAGGTKKMVEAAIRGLSDKDGKRPLVIGVTQLTSTSYQELKDELWIDKDMDQTVIQYATIVKNGGGDGVVCSPLEAAVVKEALGQDFVTVTPGIRFADSAKDDQARITTPLQAGKIGCDYIVVGRPITKAEDPVAAYERCLNEFVYGKEK